MNKVRLLFRSYARRQERLCEPCTLRCPMGFQQMPERVAPRLAADLSKHPEQQLPQWRIAPGIPIDLQHAGNCGTPHGDQGTAGGSSQTGHLETFRDLIDQTGCAQRPCR